MSVAPPTNPLGDETRRALDAQPCTLVILGGKGDLARRKLLPAVYNLMIDGLLPAGFAVVGSSRTPLTDDAYRAFGRDAVEEFSRRPADPARLADFEKLLYYVSGSGDDAATYAALQSRLEQIEQPLGIPGNRVFYLAVPPSLVPACVEQLGRSGLAHRADSGGPFTRVVIEKPIGHDLASARAVNETLLGVFDERQIFRIDHYLGKETVQNILALRFANSIFEPLWNHKYIDHVQITVAEAEGIGTRADYYEEAGALRDIVQNHILQVLCLTAAEPPWSLEPDVVRNATLEVLHCLRPIRSGDVEHNVVRAQYARGFLDGEPVPGYGDESGVTPGSTAETYVALRVLIDNWRWAGVPFFLRTGKRMPKRASEIAVQFRQVPQILFNADPHTPIEPNVLTLRIQPDEGLSLRIATKLPGASVRIYPVKMDFRYGATFGGSTPEAYERLLLDVMAGDQTLFMRRDAVEASWAWITNMLEAWQKQGKVSLPQYAAGTWGPPEADRLIGPDRQWRRL